MNQHDLKALMESYSYEHVREIDGMLCGLMRYLFTVGVCFGLDEGGLKGRFCFDTYQNAELFLREWDGKTYPVVGDDGCTAIKGMLQPVRNAAGNLLL